MGVFFGGGGRAHPPGTAPVRGASARVAGVLLFLLVAAHAAAAEEPFSGELSLQLQDALCRTERDGVRRHNLNLYVVCQDGDWTHPVGGWGVTFNRSDSQGQVLEAAWQWDGLRLVVEMNMVEDPWVPGGPARYELKLRRKGDQLEGRYDGAFKDEKVSGAADGTLWSFAPVKDFLPPGPGEHPRLFFRKDEVPALRRGFKTAAGRALRARVEELLEARRGGKYKAYLAAGYGLLALLDEDVRQAETARAVVEEVLRLDFQTATRWDSAEPLLGLALAYDLCYELWDAEFRTRLAAFLRDSVNFHIGADGGNPNKGMEAGGPEYEHLPGAWQGVVRGAAGVAALAIWRDPLPGDGTPSAYTERKIAAPPDFDPGKGVPICAFENDTMPSQWLYAGPFVPPRASLWGPYPRPEPPTPVRSPECGVRGASPDSRLGTPNSALRTPDSSYTLYGAFGMERTFKPVPFKAVFSNQYVGNKPALDLLAVHAPVYPAVTYYYTVVDNDRARRVCVRFYPEYNYTPIRAWISGQEIWPREIVELGAGRHPFLVQVARDYARHQLWVNPRFLEVTAENEKGLRPQGDPSRGAHSVEYAIHVCENAARRVIQAYANHRHVQWRGADTVGSGEVWARAMLPFLQALRKARGLPGLEGVSPETVLPLALAGREATPALPSGPLALAYALANSGASAAPAAGKEPRASPPAGLSSAGAGASAAPAAQFMQRYGPDGDGSFGMEFPHHALWAVQMLAGGN